MQLKRRCDGFTLSRTDESGGVASHLGCENRECWEILLTSLRPLFSPCFPVWLSVLASDRFGERGAFFIQNQVKSTFDSLTWTVLNFVVWLPKLERMC